VISIKGRLFLRREARLVMDEAIQTLTELGLTLSQAKVYLTLLKLDRATGKALSKHAKEARQEVYRILHELEEKGFVERIIAMPTEFKAITIKNCLRILIEHQKHKISKHEKKQLNYLKNLKKLL
jgi:sugar-specific transcriptional regulator TrmB